MMQHRDDQLVVTAPMVIANANALLHAGLSAFDKGARRIDFSAVHEADSSALALIFAWMRDAAQKGRSLELGPLPESIRSLADLYDLSELLPLA